MSEMIANYTKGFYLFIYLLSIGCYGQQTTLESQNEGFSSYKELHRLLSISAKDSNRINVLNQLSHFHKFQYPDSGIYYGSTALALARTIYFYPGELDALHVVALSHRTLRNYSKALKIDLEGLRLAEKYGEKSYQGIFLFNLGIVYNQLGDYKNGLIYLRNSIPILTSTDNDNLSILAENWLGKTYADIGKIDSALFFSYGAHNKAIQINLDWVLIWPSRQLGELHYRLQNIDSAYYYYLQAFQKADRDGAIMSNTALSIAKLYQESNQNDSSFLYANIALDKAISGRLFGEAIDACLFLTDIFKGINQIKALAYNEMVVAYKDSLNQIRQNTTFGDIIDFDVQQRKYEIDSAKKEFKSQLRINVLLGSSFTLVVIAFFLYRNNRSKQQAKKRIEKAYMDLRNTQSQLIQSEKMASLGELTAGIAHEIQNPLNFVNNFSEVSEELVTELKEELENGEVEEAKEISMEVIENLKKINHHGQRASGIVKGMLEHSRSGSGEKILTDINKLADEYLRLSFHGLRAKDKSFNADFKTDFDETLPKINVIAQDIGRVFLNLINNAFYAVDKKSKEMTPQPPRKGGAKNAPNDFKPIVIVSTSSKSPSGDLGVKISVKDNGEGIPEQVRDKIFQPFFTTKPTGSGTGLGLSLSYDIVKAHGGEIKVETKEGEGTEFIIHLPIV